MIRSGTNFKYCIRRILTSAAGRRGILTAPQSQPFAKLKALSRPPVCRMVAVFNTTNTAMPGSSEHVTHVTETEGTKHSEDQELDMLEEERERALEAAVALVPTLGWSREALETACLQLNLSPGLHSLVMPRGPIDLVLYFYESRNHRLADELARWRMEDIGDNDKHSIIEPNRFGFEAPPPFKTKRETDAFLRRAIEYRLRSNDEVYPYWRHAMALLALPQNIPAAIGLEAQLVDEIWAQAGDRSVDMNWYVKRLGLAYVYKLTELFYIQDTSSDHQETWKFLDRRIRDLRAMKEAKLQGISSMLREGIFAIGHVTSNILGWGSRESRLRDN